MDDTESKSVLDMRAPVLVVVTSLVLGGIVFLVSHITGRFTRQQKNSSPKRSGVSGTAALPEEEKTIEKAVNSRSDGGQNIGATTGSSSSSDGTSVKRAKNKKRREAQQEFTHPWVVGALKGHTGPVLDINFSSNGKFLASSAEDCDLVPEEEPELDVQGVSLEASSTAKSSTSGRTTVGSNPRSSKKNPKAQREATSRKDSEDSPTLSRRQRKNRTRAPREQQQQQQQQHQHQHQQEQQEVREYSNDCIDNSSPGIRRRHSTMVHSSQQSDYLRDDNSDISQRLIHHHNSTVNLSREMRESMDIEFARTLPPNVILIRSTMSNGVSTIRTVRREEPVTRVHVLPQPVSTYLVPVYNEVCTGPGHCFQTITKSIVVERIPDTSQDMIFPTSGPAMIKRINEMNAPILLPSNRRASGKSMSVHRRALNHVSDGTIVTLLQRYLLTSVQRTQLGYPTECSHMAGCASILYQHHSSTGHRARRHLHNLDANAKEFVPRSSRSAVRSRDMIDSDSGNGSGSGSSLENSDQEPEFSSDSDKNSESGESASSSSSSSTSGDEQNSSSETIIERPCARCRKSFYVYRDNGQYVSEDVCVHHWGKLRGSHDKRHCPSRWECCQGLEDSQGCTSAPCHVWIGVSPGYNGPLFGYVKTRCSMGSYADGNYGIYGLDCEMCFTKRGLDIAKVSLVDLDGNVVYDTLVKPEHEVIDYNTRFSGITRENLATATKSLQDVQNDLLNLINSRTILIGHGLENDLRALRIIHKTVVDTAISYPHFLGYPYRSSLKTLAKVVLKKNIQVSTHDSVEDARTVVDLMLIKLLKDLS